MHSEAADKLLIKFVKKKIGTTGKIVLDSLLKHRTWGK